MMIYIFHSLIQKSFLKREAKKIVKSSIQEENDFNFAKFDAIENTLKEITDACLEVPMLENKKVVIVENAFFLALNNKTKDKINSEKDYEYFIKYLKKPCEETDLILLVYSDKLDTKGKIYKALNGKANIASFAPLKEKDWEKYTQTLVDKRKLNIEYSAIKELAKRTLNDRDRLINEIEKLSLYSDKINLNDIVTLVAEPIEDSAFALSNALLKGDTASSLFTFYDLMKIKNTQPEVLLMMLASQFRFIYTVTYMCNKQGKDLLDVASELNANEFRVKIAYQNGKKLKKITKLFDDIYDLDLKIKSGRIDHVLALELFLINFKKNYF